MTFNRRLIFKTVSVIMLFEGLAMLIPFGFACYFHEVTTATAFFCTMVVCVSFGETMRRVVKKTNKSIKTREGYFVVIVSWFFVILIGAMPYLMSGQGYSFAESWFESCAGFTTTGATSVNLALMPKSLVLWKTISSWLGGMGIIVLTISIFPRLGIGGQKMAAAEVPGPELEKLTARFGDTAKISYRIYLVLTAIEFLMLLPTNMEPYYALINTLSTISTAGIVDLTSTQAGFVITPYIKFVLATFSLAGSMSFIAYFMLYVGKWREAINHYETRVYLRIVLVAGIIVSLGLYFSGTYDSYPESLGNGLVQVISFASTSGFVIADIGSWPTICKMILLCVVLIGGCGFSTSGSFKVIRAIVGFKIIMRGIYKRIHPQSVKPIMIQGNPVSASNASSITVFLLLYFAIFVFSAIVLSLENQDMETTLSTVVAAFTNNGTCFGKMTGSYFGIYSWFGKFYSSILMLAGRLEMYAVIVLFSRSFWNSDRARS